MTPKLCLVSDIFTTFSFILNGHTFLQTPEPISKIHPSHLPRKSIPTTQIKQNDLEHSLSLIIVTKIVFFNYSKDVSS